MKYFGYIPASDIIKFMDVEIKDFEEIVKEAKNKDNASYDPQGVMKQKEYNDAMVILNHVKNMKGHMRYTCLL
jgi:predicted RNA-binding protein (virulence factor B family)